MILISYKVKGIKTLDRMISLSFYKKTLTAPIDIQEYNIKGIYGMNGSGKSGIINSVDILRNLLVHEDYLGNPMVQNNLDALINKKTKELYMGAEFLSKVGNRTILYNYEVVLTKNLSGKYVIDYERLSYKRATSGKEEFDLLVEVRKGEIVGIYEDEDDFKEIFIKKTTNLLSNATISALFTEKSFPFTGTAMEERGFLFISFAKLFLFGSELYVYMDQSDSHTAYFLRDMIRYSSDDGLNADSVLNQVSGMNRSRLNPFSVAENYISKEDYEDYVASVRKLQAFIQIFKSDLIRIDIDRKEDAEFYVCNMIMVYEAYSIHAEFESTGIKKLIKLFAYLQKMAEGGIVFIDEFDSNLHDVYLCALLEYLMDYGKGQLCFTTQNVGPMDVLKKHKKSIEFLSVDHQVYPWTKNGNYSPSNLYKNGMIEGSPFNVDSIDFIGIFDRLDEED